MVSLILHTFLSFSLECFLLIILTEIRSLFKPCRSQFEATVINQERLLYCTQSLYCLSFWQAHGILKLSTSVNCDIGAEYLGFCLLSFPPNERLTFCVVINRLLRKINGTKIHNTSIILYAPDAGTQKCDSLFFVCSNLGPEIVPITCHSFVNHQIQGNFQNLQRGQEI